jgi:hypothetical protein
MGRMAMVTGMACLLLAARAAAAAEVEAEAIEPKGKIELLNGEDLTGWVLILSDKNADPAKTFCVEGGVIKCTGTPAGYMRTEKAYENYKFVIEWRFSKPGNSGVLVHMSGNDGVWPKSIECQGQYHAQGDFWVIGGTDFKEHKEGGPRVNGRNVRKLHEHNEKEVGEWNLYEIVCDRDTVRPYVNGKLMNEATECNVTSGKICIQSEGGAWECRKVTLEPLKK